MRTQDIKFKKHQEQSMSLIDALWIVQEVTEEAIYGVPVKVDNVDQEQGALIILNKLINLLKNDEAVNKNLENLIGK